MLKWKQAWVLLATENLQKRDISWIIYLNVSDSKDRQGGIACPFGFEIPEIMRDVRTSPERIFSFLFR